MAAKSKRQIVFDIETSGCKLADLAESQQEYLLREALKETDENIRQQKSDDAERFLSLYPYTAKVVAIGMFDVQNEKSFVYYENEKEEEWHSEDGKIVYKGFPEKIMLERFWHVMEKADQVITFNGRNFDIPFLMMRSAMLQVKPSKNFMGYRFDSKTHVDLLEQFTFYSATRKFNLDFYCTHLEFKHQNLMRFPEWKYKIFIKQEELKILRFTAGKISLLRINFSKSGKSI